MLSIKLFATKIQTSFPSLYCSNTVYQMSKETKNSDKYPFSVDNSSFSFNLN